MRRQRSTAGALVGEVLNSLGESDATTPAPANSVEDFGHGRLRGQATEFTREVLLKRLPPLLRTALERSMDVVGEVSHEHIRHAYIMKAYVGFEQVPSSHGDPGPG